jgi:hypothetical protein
LLLVKFFELEQHDSGTEAFSTRSCAPADDEERADMSAAARSLRRR